MDGLCMRSRGSHLPIHHHHHTNRDTERQRESVCVYVCVSVSVCVCVYVCACACVCVRVLIRPSPRSCAWEHWYRESAHTRRSVCSSRSRRTKLDRRLVRTVHQRATKMHMHTE
jgi:hypothetical protein